MHDIVHKVIDGSRADSFLERVAAIGRLRTETIEKARAGAEAKRLRRRQHNLRIANDGGALRVRAN